MKRLRKFFAGMLFGQSQVRREPAQLERPPFQLSMTSTEGLLSLFVLSDVAHQAQYSTAVAIDHASLVVALLAEDRE